MQSLTTLFKTSLFMSFNASIVIGVVLIIRKLFCKAPKVFSYGLWLFVFIRLVVPITFQHQSSVLTVPQALNNSISFQQMTNVESTQQQALASTASASKLTVIESGAIIWVIGIVILGVYFGYSYYRLRKVTRFAIRIHDNVYTSDEMLYPFVMGINKPRIYIPSTLKGEQLTIVLMHERVHIQRKDPLVKTAALLVLIIHWFNPLVWLSFYLMSQDMELSCDEKVIKNLGEQCKYSFGSTLLDFAVSPYSVHVAFNETSTKVRIKHIMNYKKPKFWIVIACFVGFLFLLIPLLSNPIREQTSNTLENSQSSANIDYIAPLKNYEITCAWGCYAGHEGIDMRDPNNKDADVLAIAEGVIYEVGTNPDRGNYMVLQHRDGTFSLYGQLKEESSLAVGTQVRQGDVLNQTGQTGKASGVHLHFILMNQEGVPLANTVALIEVGDSKNPTN